MNNYTKSTRLILGLILYMFTIPLHLQQVNANIINEQKAPVLKGKVVDKKTSLIGATVAILELNKVDITDENGEFSFNLPTGTYTISISYLGYSSYSKKIDLANDQTITITLKEDSSQLEELVIVQNVKKTNIRTPEMSVNKLSIEDVKKMPAVLGETDVLKSILSLPGVTNAGEGASGFNVRGGSAGQNLILLDDANVFSSSHLFGFFSIFNSDAINDLKLYKGGIPARFGGRASSVLEVFQKNGNTNEYHGTGGIGIISSRLMAEGPIQKGKSSFLVAGRASYAHLFLKLTDNNSSAYFYDLNTKLNFLLDDKNKITFSGYFGRDVFNFANLFKNNFGNTVLNTQWHHLFKDDLSSKLTLTYSDYMYGFDMDLLKFKWDSSIKNYQLKYDFTQDINTTLQLKYGVSTLFYDFSPGTIKPTRIDSSINYRKLDSKYAFEGGAYLEAEQSIGQHFSLNYGVRFSTFSNLGKEDINLYQDSQPVRYDSNLGLYKMADAIGKESYSKGKSIQNYNNFEPRLGLAYILNDDQSIKASYNRMAQYIHLMSNTAAPTPLDIWTPSSKYIKPEIIDQVALGYFHNFKEGKYSLETEVFYKKGKNRIDYIDGAQLIGNEAIERVILVGESRAYGLELLLRKNLGRLTGWMSYTLSKSEQRTPGRTAEEPGINNGEWYRTAYDKTHDFSVTAMYELNPKWSLSASFTLQSGRPTSYPEGRYDYLGQSVPNFGKRNAYSLPSYHHLDVSATYSPKGNAHKRWQSEWVFGIYNLYGRANAASISFRENEDYRGQNEAVKMSIFGLVPSVTYNFKF
ncbi:TonB-dependent receptor [Myroides sp. M-43]|uniref:TonB-dependent receptor n=1 Tax=Myroides oncorhynchi TaxID=2893756 RepID=UPI001E5DB33D|nr:TonB-dependent receptor [Myroides oncorhynchi]MCC9041438.1 TonB-dependent receptor [Myroides oncorhynchi]